MSKAFQGPFLLQSPLPIMHYFKVFIGTYSFALNYYACTLAEYFKNFNFWGFFKKAIIDLRPCTAWRPFLTQQFHSKSPFFNVFWLTGKVRCVSKSMPLLVCKNKFASTLLQLICLCSDVRVLSNWTASLHLGVKRPNLFNVSHNMSDLLQNIKCCFFWWGNIVTKFCESHLFNFRKKIL